MKKILSFIIIIIFITILTTGCFNEIENEINNIVNKKGNVIVNDIGFTLTDYYTKENNYLITKDTELYIYFTIYNNSNYDKTINSISFNINFKQGNKTYSVIKEYIFINKNKTTYTLKKNDTQTIYLYSYLNGHSNIKNISVTYLNQNIY